MLQEYTGGRCVSYRVNPQQGGSVETVAEVYAQDFFRERDNLITSPTSPRTRTRSAPARQARRRVEAALERIFLPDGYPNSVTEDLLPFVLWDLAQVLASSVMATLSTRAVLLGVGVGESKADLTSSTVSWMMRDGTRMIGSVVFASLISQGLEHRAKTWRLVADFTSDMAGLLELCAPWLPGGETTFRVVVIAASLIKALVSVCGNGTRASFTQHFALRNNAADISAKAATCGNAGSLLGLALGMAVAYIIPAMSRRLNLAVFALCSAFHIFANYRGVREVQLTHLNAPRLEWCLEKYCLFKAEVLIASKKDSGPLSVMPILDASPRSANAAERLFILPALPAVPSASKNFYASVYRLLCRHCFPATLTLRIHCGASLLRLLQRHSGLTTRRKHELVQQVESALASQGIALLVDGVDMIYYMILPEFFTGEGVPANWVRYKRQHEASLRCMEPKQHQSAASSAVPQRQDDAARSSLSIERTDSLDAGRRLDETGHRAASAQAAADLAQAQKERIVFPAHILPLAYRQLWAYFYAFMHYRAMLLRREGLPAQARGALEDSCKNSSLEYRQLHIINALRADGTLEEAPHDAPGTPPYSPAQFEKMASPTPAKSAVLHTNLVFPCEADGEGRVDGDNIHAPSHDGLYPHFTEFVRVLRKTGWELDELQIRNEGFTTVVHYL